MAETKESEPLINGILGENSYNSLESDSFSSKANLPEEAIDIPPTTPDSPEDDYDDTEEINQQEEVDEAQESTITVVGNDTRPLHAKRFLKKFAGIILALISGIFAAGLAISVKVLTNHEFHPFLLTLIKYQASTIIGPPLLGCMYCCNKQQNRNMFQGFWPLTERGSLRNLFLVLVRTTLGVFQTILHYWSLKYLNVADSCVIIMCNSITTVFLAKLFLNEPLGVVPILVGLFTLAGVVVIANPPFLTGKEAFDENMLTGVTLAFISMFLASLIIIIVRHMRRLHFCLFVTMYGYMATLEIIILIAIENGFGNVISISYEPKYLYIMVGIALFAFTSQSLNVLSLRFERASHISLIRSCDIIFTFWLQYIILGVSPDKNTEIGTFILITGTLIIGLRRWLMSLPTNHNYRTKYRFLLK